MPSVAAPTQSKPKRKLGNYRDLVLSPAELVLLYGGMFFTFSAAGWMLALIFGSKSRILSFGVYFALITGGFACLWAYCFISRRYWLLPVVLLAQMFGPWLIAEWFFAPFGFFSLGAGGTERQRLAVHAIAAMSSIVVGYICSMVFLHRVEGRTVRAQAELDVARTVHESIVPNLSLTTPLAEVFGQSHASSEMGGDLIDVIARGEEIDVYLVDVSGHGVGAGIVMAMVKSSIRTRLRERVPLADLLNGTNSVLAEMVKPGMFATMACVRLAPLTSPTHSPSQPGSSVAARCEYALAGHLPILLWRAATGVVEELPNEHLPLAVDAGEEYRTGATEIRPGDTILMLTDGLVEVLDQSGRQLGMNALREVLRRDGGKPLTALHAALTGIARSHGRQIDDQSVLLVRLRDLSRA